MLIVDVQGSGCGSCVCVTRRAPCSSKISTGGTLLSCSRSHQGREQATPIACGFGGHLVFDVILLFVFLVIFRRQATHPRRFSLFKLI